jgi:hypothetical protein
MPVQEVLVVEVMLKEMEELAVVVVDTMVAAVVIPLIALFTIGVLAEAEGLIIQELTKLT